MVTEVDSGISLHEIPFVNCYLLCSVNRSLKNLTPTSGLRNKAENMKNRSNT